MAALAWRQFVLRVRIGDGGSGPKIPDTGERRRRLAIACGAGHCSGADGGGVYPYPLPDEQGVPPDSQHRPPARHPLRAWAKRHTSSIRPSTRSARSSRSAQAKFHWDRIATDLEGRTPAGSRYSTPGTTTGTQTARRLSLSQRNARRRGTPLTTRRRRTPCVWGRQPGLPAGSESRVPITRRD